MHGLSYKQVLDAWNLWAQHGGMNIRNLINRFLDSEFGAYPATRGAVVVVPTLTARPAIIRIPEATDQTEVTWPGRDWAPAQ